AFGNFTGQSQEGKPDMAFLLEKQDYQSSALFVISSLGDILYWKEYSSDLPIINAFKKGSKIFIDKPTLGAISTGPASSYNSNTVRMPWYTIAS
ncbi:MAG TPA: hypothetical protein VL943_03250, partial [Niabella sp.]|nr:hypothetical protein [Niabella sp.]